MGIHQFEITDSFDESKRHKKFDWYWAFVYCAIWYVLFYVAAIPSFYNYPETLLIRDEHHHTDQFIGERARQQLLQLDKIGVKLTGTVENEVYAVNFLLNEIEKIKTTARLDLYDIEVDVQHSSGDFILWGMAISYQNVSNVIVKLSPKHKTSNSYLLVNSHFDSEVHSPAAADDGVMVVIMLETLRVISHSERPLNNAIVFLLNGAEESKLLASHGFITRHKWAQYCKALVNLDSAGSGGREVLFQSGPNHPWLMKYYKQSVPHPYASTIAEELFQNNFIPSDTDFRIFRQYGGVPGLDMAHTLNGYIYHTKYDTWENLERGTYQTTGDNVLALTWAIANAPELDNPEAYAEGHTVFYDFLGWFMVFYTESTGVAINITISICAVLFIAISLHQMTRAKDLGAPKQLLLRAFAILGVQIVTVALAVGLTLLMAVIIDGIGLSECWYSAEWLIFGLYFCPLFFVLCILPGLYMHWTQSKTNMRQDDTIAVFMHSHCLILVFICLLMTGLSIRSAFFPMIAIFFYTISLTLNIINRIWGKKFLYWPIHLICQLLPFWFYTYLTFAFFKTFIPMQGRDGPTSKPEILLAMFSIIMGLHFSGFILPMLHKFRKSKTLISIFGILTLVFIIIAATPAGFPYKKDVAAQRFYTLHTSRTFYDESENVYKNESGFYIQPVDTRLNTLTDSSVFDNAMPKDYLDEDCRLETFCGLPLYSTRWMEWKNSARWVPAATPNLPIPTDIKLASKVYLNDTKIRLFYTLKSADRVVIYVDPLPQVKVIDWSFDLTPLKENHSTPYFVYHMYSMTETPLEFWIEVEREKSEGPLLRLGIGAHYLHHEQYYTEEYKEFLKRFPEWSYPLHWFAAFESHIY